MMSRTHRIQMRMNNAKHGIIKMTRLINKVILMSTMSFAAYANCPPSTNGVTFVPGYGKSCIVLKNPNVNGAHPLEGDTLLVSSDDKIDRIGKIFYKVLGTPRGVVFVTISEDDGSLYEINYWEAATRKIKECTPKAEDKISVGAVREGRVSISIGNDMIRIARGLQSKDYMENCENKGNNLVYLNLSKQDKSILEEFRTGGASNEWTNPEIAATFPTVLGRDEEINKVISSLRLTAVRSSLIIGKPGIGKTAIVQALAKKIVAGDVPDFLKDWSIYSIEISKLGDEGVKGKAESKATRLLDAAVGKKVILLFDEMHKLVGKGATNENSSDITETMKTPLADGRLALIGTTTDDKDEIGLLRLKQAFFQRFNQVYLKELPDNLLLKIFRQEANELEKKYATVFSDENLRQILDLTRRYVSDQAQPRVSLKVINQIASDLALEKSGKVNVTDDDARNAVGQIANIPSLITKAANSKCEGLPYREKAKNFTSEMRKGYVGQEEAVTAVQQTLSTIALGLNDPKRPGGVFLFLGPSGVGKTYFGERLGELFCMPVKIFGMSKYRDESSINAFSGSDKGYVGYDRAGGELTRWIKENPESVLIFDEIDKANPLVLESLVQLLDDGVYTDKADNEVKFRNGFIILTSNFGMDLIDAYDKKVLGLKNPREGAFSKPLPQAIPNNLDQLKNEILNMLEGDGKFGSYMAGRVGRDNTIVFHHLTPTESRQIAELEIARVVKQLGKRNIKVSVKPEIATIIGQEAYDFKIGARRARELAEKYVRQSSTSALLKEMTTGKNFSEIIVAAKEMPAPNEKTLVVIPEDIKSGKLASRQEAQRGVCNGGEFIDLVREFPTSVKERFIGQDNAVNLVYKALTRMALGNKPGKAAGRFLFLGPSGVGKTYLAKLTAEMFCLPIIVYPMEMYQGEDAINTFVGSAPGYIGYRETGGSLTQWVKANPNSVIVFDEIDKSNPIVLEALMQFLDTGTITDKAGQSATMKGGLIFLTSNFAMELIDAYDKQVLKIADPREVLKTEIRDLPQTEEALQNTIFDFLSRDRRLGTYMQGRIGRNNIVVYHHFRPEEIKKLVQIEVKKALADLDSNIQYFVDPALVEHIAKVGFDFATGARHAGDTVQEYITDVAAQAVITISEKQRAQLKKIVFTVKDVSSTGETLYINSLKAAY